MHDGAVSEWSGVVRHPGQPDHQGGDGGQVVRLPLGDLPRGVQLPGARAGAGLRPGRRHLLLRLRRPL